MKNRIVYLVALFVVLFLFKQCKKVEKNITNLYPKVETSSAKVEPDGSVTISATILGEGSEPVKYAGFCMDTLPEPKMLDNQQTVDTIFGKEFHTSYKGLLPYTKYYFRSFVANANGYAYGNTISVNNVQIDSNIFSCKPAKDTIKIASSFKTSNYRISRASAPKIGSDWDVTVETGEYIMTISFADFPKQGIYTITDASGIYGQYVNVLISGPITNFGGVNFKEGAKLYVRSIDVNHIEYSFCGAKFWSGTDYTVDTRFVSSVK